MAVTFGYSTLGTSQFPCADDRAYGNRFTLSASGTLASGRVGFEASSGGGGNAKLLVYTNASGVPGTLVAASNGVAITGAGWHDFTFAGEAITVADYFLICVTDAGAFANYFAVTAPSTAGDAVMANNTLSYSTPPSTWPGTDATYDQMLSIEVTVDDAAPGAMVGSAALALVPVGTLVSSTMAGAVTLALVGSATLTNLTPPTTDNFGDETLYTDSLPTSVGRMLGKQFTADANGTLLSISVGFAPTSAGTFNIKALLYSDTADAPVTLLGASNVVVHTTGGGFFTATFSSGPSIVLGTKYWLYGMTDDNGGLGEHAHNTFGTGTGVDAYMAQPGSFSFASPPSTMPAATATYDYDVSIYATVQLAASGAMVGNVALGLTPAATLVGAGAMVASSPLAITLSLVSSATGLLAGSTALSLTPSATLSGAGAMVGSTALALTTAATLDGAGAMAGATALVLDLTGTFTLPSLMVGDVALLLIPAGTLSGAGAIAGSTALSLSLAGAMAAPGMLVGNTSMQLIPSASIGYTASIVGSLSLALDGAAQLLGHVQLVGSVALSITSTGSMVGTVQIVGSSALSLVPSGTLAGAGAMIGSVGLSLAPSGTLSGAGAMVGSTTLSMSLLGSGMANGELPLVGSLAISLTPSAALVGTGAMVGSINLQLANAGTGGSIVGMTGNVSMSLDAAATGNLLGFMNGNVAIAMAMVAALLGRAALVGSTALRFTLRATPEGYIPPVDEEFIIVWEDDPPSRVVLANEIPVVVIDDEVILVQQDLAVDAIVWEDAP